MLFLFHDNLLHTKLVLTPRTPQMHYAGEKLPVFFSLYPVKSEHKEVIHTRLESV